MIPLIDFCSYKNTCGAKKGLRAIENSIQVRQQAETITEYREELARLESHIFVDVD